jgi:hypothetical protein
MAGRISILCPACNEPLPISDDYFVRHFEGKPAACGKCGAQLDWWTTASHDIEAGYVFARESGASADESWKSMADAFESYSHQRYPSMIVPANAAVESGLSGLLSRHLPSLVSKRRADDFPDAAASYAHRLNVLLPMIAHYNGIPQLPPDVHVALGKLRVLRNDLAQGGVASSTLDARAAAELLCGALFGVQYLRYVEGRL